MDRGSTSIGSLHTMAPEQLGGGELSAATDLFSVGVLLFEALTGELPYPGANPEEVRASHAAGPPAAVSELAPVVGPRVSNVIAQALRIDPAARFASADAMRSALAAVAVLTGAAIAGASLLRPTADPSLISVPVYRSR